MSPLALMVDLGWDWWVSTLIALSVAVVAGAVALRARRADVRAVAAVLAIEGVAIAVIAPFVMDNSSGRSAMDGPRLTRVEFVRRADANCAAVGKAFVAAGNPQTPAAIGRTLDQIMPTLLRRTAQQGTLVPPAADQSTAGRWMTAMNAANADYAALGAAGNSRDAAGIKAASALLAADSERSAQLSKQLGLKVCFA